MDSLQSMKSSEHRRSVFVCSTQRVDAGLLHALGLHLFKGFEHAPLKLLSPTPSATKGSQILPTSIKPSSSSWLWQCFPSYDKHQRQDCRGGSGPESQTPHTSTRRTGLENASHGVGPRTRHASCKQLKKDHAQREDVLIRMR